MDKKEIAILLLSSAVIGALFSAAITVFASGVNESLEGKNSFSKFLFAVISSSATHHIEEASRAR